FISSFKLENINHCFLFWGMIFFAVSIASILLVYLFSYLSCAFGAKSSLEQTAQEFWSITIDHYKERGKNIPKEWDENLKKTNTPVNKNLQWAEYSEYAAVILAVIGMSL